MDGAPVGRDQDRGGARGLERRAVLAVDEEREMARLSFVEARYVRDFDARVALEFATENLGDVSEFHGELLMGSTECFARPQARVES